MIVAIEDGIHRFKYASGSSEELFDDFRLIIARHESAGGDMSATSVALAALRTFSDIPELIQLAKMVHLTIESKLLENMDKIKLRLISRTFRRLYGLVRS